ncbi:uncharacterized protein LOC123014746 isoform X1 [Tribolium madens]|uniref:uncharacterized protein LOC123014746 isoform X1 n=2 Tax=Tribolium madens TaxID=41895 RepID=UPI001CF728E9|nr:uncharacterized protein LOC123014746 isoform X1 [Tribolium madens]XP_044269939.1 uncharacterized protein LOC123014746 isoform X1 [Tribolium madens]
MAEIYRCEEAAMEKLQAVPEPEWILDRTGTGPLYWRRESPECNSRVKFRFDVEVKEFQRSAHEFEDLEWSRCIEDSNTLTMGLACIICITVTVMLPWYIMVGTY